MVEKDQSRSNEQIEEVEVSRNRTAAVVFCRIIQRQGRDYTLPFKSPEFEIKHANYEKEREWR